MQQFLKIWLIAFLTLPIFAAAEEIYNFPDLVPDVKLTERLDTNSITVPEPKAWGIVTNLSFYDIRESADGYSYFKKSLADLMINEIENDPEKVLVSDFLRYDMAKRRILSSLREYRPEVQDGGEQGLGLIKGSDTQGVVDLRLFGKQNITLKWGKALTLYQLDRSKSVSEGKYKYTGMFSKKMTPEERWKAFADSKIAQGFVVEPDLSVNLKGKIGERIKMDVRYNQNNTSKGNEYSIKYEGRPKDLVQGVEIGKVFLNTGGKSRFVTTGGSTKEAVGLGFSGGKNNFTFKAIASFTRGVSKMKTIKIGERLKRTNNDISYIQKKFYQLPDKDIIDYDLYESVVITNSGTAWDLVVTNSDTFVAYYFIRVAKDNKKYKIDSGRGVFIGTGSAADANKRSILFYKWSDTTNRAATASNSIYFFGTNHQLTWNGVPPGDPLLYSNFAVIHWPLSSSDFPYSYELRNHYPFSAAKMARSSFEMRFYRRDDNAPLESVWSRVTEFEFPVFGKAKLLPDESYYYFESTRPFTNTNSSFPGNPNLYDKFSTAIEDSALIMEYSWEEEFQGFIQLDDYNVVPNSVVVYRGSTRMEKSEYTVSSYNGRILFNKPSTTFIKGQEITVHYEYEPYGDTLQQALFGGRLEYGFGGASYIGSSFAMATGQSTLTAPQAGAEPSRQIVADIDSTLDIATLMRRRKGGDLTLQLKGEAAWSFYDRNKKNSARLNDFEADSRTFTLPKRPDEFYFSANPVLEEIPLNVWRLGKVYFKDFYEYSIGGNRTPLVFAKEVMKEMAEDTTDGINKRKDVNIRPFDVKPGPYLVQSEGHLDPYYYPGQSAMVYEYDFSEPKSNGSHGYVSFTLPVGNYFRSTRNFEGFNSIEIIYKLVPAPKTPEAVHDGADYSLHAEPDAIGMKLELGYSLNEDLDLDGNFDSEIDENDTAGYTFNYSNGYTVQTRAGRGSKGFTDWRQIVSGNGVKDSEDLNKDGNLYQSSNEFKSKIDYPAIDTFGEDLPFFTLLSAEELGAAGRIESNGITYEVLDNYVVSSGADYSGDTWRKASYVKMTVPLNQVYTNTNISSVNGLRLSLMEATNVTNAMEPDHGMLVLGSLIFKGTTWQKVMVDGVVVDKPRQFEAGVVDSKDDDWYSKKHVATAFRDEYENLYGDLRGDDFSSLVEKSFNLQYRLNGSTVTASNDTVNGKFGIIEQMESAPVNISYYKEQRFYAYSRSTDSGDEIFIYRFGRSSNDYWEFRTPVKNLTDDGKWSEITFKMRPFKTDKDSEKKALEAAFTGDHYFPVFRRTGKTSSDGSSKPSSSELLDNTLYTVIQHGYPTLADVQYFALGVDAPSGAIGNILINNISLYEDEVRSGGAYFVDLIAGWKKPVMIKDFELFSAFNSVFGFLHKGTDFLSVDAAEKGQPRQDSVYAGIGGNWLSFLQMNYNGSSSFSLSEVDTSLRPLDNQFAENVRANTVDFNSAIKNPRWKKYIPQIGHNITSSAYESVKASAFLDTNAATNAVTNTDEGILKLTRSQTDTKSYLLKESQTLQMSKKFSINHNWSMKTSMTKRVVYQTNVERSLVNFVDPQSRWTNIFYPLKALKSPGNGKFVNQLSPVWDLFPDLESGNAPDDTVVSYNFGREQTAGFGMNYDQLFDVSVTWAEGISDNLSISNLNASLLSNLLDSYEEQKYIASMFVNHESKLKNSLQVQSGFLIPTRNMRWNAVFNWNKPVVFKKYQFLTSINLGFGFSHSEENPSYSSKSFNYGSFLSSLGDLGISDPNFVDILLESTNYFSNQHRYKNYNDLLTMKLSVPVGLGKMFVSRINYSDERSVLLRVYNALDENPSETIWADLKNTLDSRSSLYGKSTNLILDFSHDDRRMDWFLSRSLDAASSPPYASLSLMKELSWWSYALVKMMSKDYQKWGDVEKGYRKAHVQSWMRRVQAVQVDEALSGENGYRERNGGKTNGEASDYYPTKLNAHSEYRQEITVVDKYRMVFNFNLEKYKIKGVSYLSYFVPATMSINGSLTTSKLNGWEMDQSENRDITLDRDFNKLMDVINKRYFKPDEKGKSHSLGLAGSYRMETKKNYKAKTTDQNHYIRVNPVIRLKRKSGRSDLTLTPAYNLRISQFRQSTRFAWQSVENGKVVTHVGDWMGIGSPWSDADGNRPFYGDSEYSNWNGTLKEWLNAGDLENPGNKIGAKTLGGDMMDYDSFDHTAAMAFSWQDDSPFTLKLFKKVLIVPKGTGHNLGLDFSLRHYKVPFVNTDVYKDGNYLPQFQLDPVARKNLSTFSPPQGIGSAFSKWKIGVNYTMRMKIKENFNLDLTGAAALLKQVEASEYYQYLKILPDDKSLITKDSAWLRKNEYLQFGFEIGAVGSILF